MKENTQIIKAIETFLIDYAKKKGGMFTYVAVGTYEPVKEELNDDIKAFLTTVINQAEKEAYRNVSKTMVDLAFRDYPPKHILKEVAKLVNEKIKAVDELHQTGGTK